ncbi:MAG: CoA-binding protein, partial [Deltaproteobacteria bacterium]|nr:CoA-binding protein [Deltaproteobacteria bacterium]
ALSEAESKAFLKPYGIPVIEEKVAQNIDSAVKIAEQTGFPVVIKGLGKELLHKTEMGLVRLNLRDIREVEIAAKEIAKAAGDKLEGFVVQPCLTGKREFVAGLFRDETYGPIVMFGLGGIFTESLADVVFRLAPLSEADAMDMIMQIRSSALLGPVRGEAPVDVNILVKTLTGLSDVGVTCPDVREIDINPLLVRDDGQAVAVDALVVKGAGDMEKEFLPPVDPKVVAALFYPRSIAFIGASGKLGKWGYTLLTNTIGGGYKGKIYLVNPRGGTIAGRPVYKSVADIEENVDVAVVTIPAARVLGLIPELKAKGISYMLLIASGFAETGEQGAMAERELVKAARENDIYLIGPNTMGTCNPYIDFYCTGTHVRPKAGSIGVVAQSGNMGNQLLAFAELQGIGIRAFCGSGNEGMITIEDYLDAFEQDPLTHAAMLYIESVKNGRRFYETARRVSLKKPIVLLKGGQTDAGNKAAASHTGAMTTNAAVFNAVCRQAGIVKVEKPMDLLDLSAAFSSIPLPEGKRVAIMTLGGGWGVVTADLCESYGLEVPELSKDIIEQIDRILPPYWSRSNPVDLVGENDWSIPFTVMTELMKWDGCDAVINLGIVGRRHMASRLADSVLKSDPTCAPDILESINKTYDELEKKYMAHVVSLMEEFEKPALGVSILKEEKDQTLYDIPGKKYKGLFFPTPEQAVKSLAKMYEYRSFQKRANGISS